MARLRIWNAASKLSESKAKAMKISIDNQHMFAFLFFLFLIYAGIQSNQAKLSLSVSIAGVSTTVMKFFKCRQIDGVWLLNADYRSEYFIDYRFEIDGL